MRLRSFRKCAWGGRLRASAGVGVMVAAFAVLWLGVGSASAQVAFTGQITGTVTDTSQALIPGAEVVVENVQTNVKSQTTTNDSGAYTILSVIPGYLHGVGGTKRVQEICKGERSGGRLMWYPHRCRIAGGRY